MRKRSHVNFILSLLLCAVMAFSVTAFADGEEAVQQVTDVPSAPAAGAEAPAAVPSAAEQPQETATTASSAQSEGIEIYSEPTGTLEVQQSTELVQPGPGEVSGKPVNEVGQQEAEEKKEEFSNETGTVAATEEKNSETAVLPGAPEETQEGSGTEASVESAAEVNSEDAAEEKEIPAANPSAEAVMELSEEVAEVSEESTEEDDTSYSVTITDTSGASVDVTGGAETLISDLLVSLGYDVPEDALIEIDPESIDTAVISVNETEKGLVLTDNGPFSKAVKNLILYVNGVAIELELVDPTKISGEKTAIEVQEAFVDKDSNPLNVILEGDTVLKGVNESVQLSLGVHDLYLNDHTLSSTITVEPGANPVPMFVIGNGVTLNVYGGADNKSAGSGLISSTAELFRVLAGGTLNLNSGSFVTTGDTLLTNEGTAKVYGGTVDKSLAGNKDAVYINESNQATAMDIPASGSVSGTYVMLRDVIRDIKITAGSITLDLNGHVLKGTGNSSVISVYKGASFTLTDRDSSAEHYFQLSDLDNGIWTQTTKPEAGSTVLKVSEITDTSVLKKNTLISVSGGVVTGGKAEKYGGGILNSGTVTLNSGSICGNSANYHGGGVYSDGTFTMNGGKICGNLAGNYGGGVYSCGTMNLSGGMISGNKTQYGGGVFNCGTFKMSSGAISANTASGNGGSLFNSSTFEMSGGTVSGSRAVIGGGVCNGGTFTMTGGEISKNTADRIGGGVMNSGTFTMSGDSSRITGNTAKTGGGVHMDAQKATFTMKGGKIDNNTATDNGGGIGNDAGTFTMTGGSIEENSAGNDNGCGGGVYNYSGTIKLTDDSATVTGNSAKYGGGVFNGGNFDLSKGTITANTAEYGNGVYNNGRFTMTDGAISENLNEQAKFGGGVYNNINATFKLAGGNINNNYAESGGGAYNSGTFTMSGDSSQITGNTAKTGGGVYNYGTLTMTKGTIESNTAEKAGGVANGGNFLLSGGSIIQNKVDKGTGGGVLNSGTFTMKGGTVSSNTGAYGGGVYTDNESATFTMAGGSIEENVATDGNGGGIYIVKSTVRISGGSIKSNTAKSTDTSGSVRGNGGGLFNFAGIVEMTGGEITGNYTELKENKSGYGMGGGVFNCGEFRMNGGTIESNNNTPVKKENREGYDVANGGLFIMNAGKIEQGTSYFSYCIYNSGDTNSYAYFFVFGGTVNGKITKKNHGDVGVYGGTFYQYNPNNYLKKRDKSDFEITYDKGNDKYTVKQKDSSDKNVVCIGNTNHEVHLYKGIYESLSQNVYDCKVILIRDLTESYKHEYGGTLELDLNGYVLKAEDNKRVLTFVNKKGYANQFNLVLKDSNSFTEHYFTYSKSGAWTLISSPTDAQKKAAVTVDQITDSTTVVKVTGGIITSGNASDGGAIYSERVFTFTMKGGSIVGNKASGTGGAVYLTGSSEENESTFTLEGGSILGNYAKKAGAVYLTGKKTSLLMKDGSISGNSSAGNGGGVFCEKSVTFRMSGGKISGNLSTGNGGGVNNCGTMTLSGGSIRGNSTYAVGGGINNSGTLIMNGGYISGNKAGTWGGGVNNSGTFTLDGGFIGDCNGDGTGANTAKNGSGVNNSATFNLKKGTVYGNIATENGGGIYNSDTFTMSGGTVSGNKTTGNGDGGGIYNSGTFTMSGGKVSGNKTTGNGGGVYNSGTLAMSNGFLNYNEANNGGGVYNLKTFTMSAGYITENGAVTGGGVHMTDNSSVFTLTGGYISANIASKAGKAGGVYFGNGTMTVGGTAYICNNTLQDKSTANNLYLPTGKTVKLSTDHPLKEDPNTNSSAKIGVSTETAPVAGTPVTVTGSSNNKYCSFFVADNGEEYFTDYAEPGSEKYTVALYSRRLVISGTTVKDKTYDGTVTAEIDNLGTVTGIAPQDSENIQVFVAAKFADKNVGENKTVSLDYFINGTAASKYIMSATGGTTTATISPAPLTASGFTVTAEKVYDGTRTAYIRKLGTFSGLINGDSVSVAVNALYADKNVGTGKEVVITYTLAGDDAKNYSAPEEAQSSASIKPRSVTLSSGSATKTYDGTELTNSSYMVTGEGFVEGEGVMCTVTGSQTDAGTSANTFTYTAETGTELSNYAITKVDGTLTVNKRPVTLTSGSATKTYDGTGLTNDAVAVTGDGFVTGEGVLFIVNGYQKNAGTSFNTFTYEAIGMTQLSNYVITKVDGTLTVTKRPLTLIAGSDTKVYDGKALRCTGVTEIGFVESEGDDVQYSVNGEQRDAGTSENKIESVTAGTTNLANYAITKESGTLTVRPRQIILTSGSASKKFDAAELKNYDVMVTGDGFAEGEGVEEYYFTGSQTDAGTSSNTFSYTLKNGTNSANYLITKVEGTLTVYRSPVTVSADDKAKFYGAADPKLTATVTGFIATSDEVSYTLTRTAGENVGTYTITPSGETVQGNYEVRFDEGTFTITPSDTLTVTGNSYEGIYDGREHGVAATPSVSDGTTVSYSTDGGTNWSTTVPTILNAGTKEIRVKAENKNYKTATTTYSLKITSKAVTVRANDLSKVYGTADPTLTATVEGTLGSDIVAYTINRATGEDVGTYTITPSGDASQGNYSVTFVPGTFTIIKSNRLTVKGIDYAGVYDGGIHGESASSNVEDGTTLSYSTDDGTTWFDTFPTIKDVGTETVLVKAENRNYETAEDTYTLKVIPKAVTVTADDGTKMYGTADPELTATVEGTLGSDTVVYTLTRAAGENVGTYAITPSGDTAQGNYTVSFNKGSFTITKSDALTVTGVSYCGVYDGQNHGTDATSNVTEGTTLSYSVDNGTTWRTEVPTIRDVENKAVLVKAENGNYITANAAYTLAVTPRPVTLTSANASKVYDGTALTAKSVTVSGDGFASEDGVTYSITGSRTAAGTSENTFTYAAKPGTNLSNYHITEQYGTLTVEKRSVTLTSDSLRKIYDGMPLTAESVTVSGDGFVDGEGVLCTFTGSRTAAGTSDNTFEYAAAAGTDLRNYNITKVSGVLTVEQKVVTVTADDKSKIYGTDDPELTAVVKGTLGGDTVHYMLSRSEGEDAGNAYFIVPEGETSQGNYSVMFVPGVFSIVPSKLLTVTGFNYEGEYDALEHGASARPSVEEHTFLTYSTDNGVTWSAVVPTIRDCGDVTVLVQASNRNYETATNSYTLKVTPKPVTVTADDSGKVYGENDPELTAVVDGIIDEYLVLYSVTRADGENAGTYVITPSGAALQGNYSVTFVPGKFTVIKSNRLTVRGTDYAGVYDGGIHGESASANVTEGTTLSYSTDDGTTWFDAFPTIKDVGTETVLVKAENRNYETAEDTYTLKVTPKAVTVSAEDGTKMYGTTDPKLTATVEGTLGSDTVIYTLTRAAGENVGTYVITPSGEILQGNYSVTFVPGTFRITAKQLTVSGTVIADKEYDGTTVATVISSGDLVGVVDGDQVAIETVTAEFVDPQIGRDKQVFIFYTLTGNSAVNYTVADGEAIASIYQKPVYIPAVNGSIEEKIRVILSTEADTVSVESKVKNGTGILGAVSDIVVAELVNSAKTGETIVVDFSQSVQTVTSAVLPGTFIRSFAVSTVESNRTDIGLKVKVTAGSVMLDNTVIATAGNTEDVTVVLRKIAISGLSTVQINAVRAKAEETDAETVAVLECIIMAGNRRLESLIGVSVKQCLSGESWKDFRPSALTLWAVAEDGTMEQVAFEMDGNGNLIFPSAGVSHYVILANG